jgi:leader peptidase (prepilin peptidase) / N-methyltransferase
MIDAMVGVLAAVVGAAVGSFLNVCVHRLPEGGSVVSPGSHCPRCSTPIAWRDNVPVASWLLLRGRCRVCEERISVRYPLVEAATALIWLAAVVRHGASWPALTTAVLFTLLLGIALTDARTYTIPDEFSIGGAGIGLALALLPGGLGFITSLAGAAFGFSLLWAVGYLGEWAFQKPAIGGGDIKMMAMVGAFLGPAGVILTVFFGSVIGTVVFGPISYRTGKLVPFGIFLALGAAIADVWGPAIVQWYSVNVLGA